MATDRMTGLGISASATPRGRPIKTSRLVAHRLAERVAELEPGSVLPPERVLIEELGVARGTLREALRLLEMQGVITLKLGPRGGPVVSRPDHRPFAEALSLFLQLEEVTFREVLEARQTLEAANARHAAEKATRAEVAVLWESVAIIRDLIDDEHGFLEENIRFHQICAVSGGNRVLMALLASLKSISDGHALGVRYSRPQRAAIADAHERVVEAIASGDGERAGRAMFDHMGEFLTYVKRRFPDVLRDRITWMLEAP